jgi:succinyl-CoA synthetase beta subunit
MKIHEYQAKVILRKYGVSVPDGETVTTLEEAETAAKIAVFSRQQSLVTHQTGPQGQKVQRLLIEQGSAIDRELVVFMASQSGDMDIEEVRLRK